MDAHTIRDGKSWASANQKSRNAGKFAAIACHLHSVAALLLPLKACLPPRCLAVPRILPNGTSDASRLCSPMSADARHDLQFADPLGSAASSDVFGSIRCVIGQHIIDEQIAGKAAP